MRMVSRESAKTAKSAPRPLTSDLFRLPSSDLCYLFRPPVKTSEVFSDIDPISQELAEVGRDRRSGAKKFRTLTAEL